MQYCTWKTERRTHCRDGEDGEHLFHKQFLNWKDVLWLRNGGNCCSTWLDFLLKQLLLLVEAKELLTEYGLFLFILLLTYSFSFSLLSQVQCTRRQLRGKGASGQEVHRRSLWWFSAEITAWVTANKLEKADIIRGRRRVHMLAEGVKLLLGCQGRGIGEPSSLAVPGAGRCEQCCVPLGPVQAGDKKHSLL